MIAFILCLIFFAACYSAGKRSLPAGIIALMAVGYFYGIIRANILSPLSHFTADAGLLGLIASQPWGTKNAWERARTATLHIWVFLLVGWPLLELLLPFQPILISIVGLRGNAFFLPILLLGARLKQRDLRSIACGLALLNIVAAVFGAAEYFLGVPRFFPESAVTSIIYSSKDVAGFTAYRIPAIFSSAHAYAGTMNATLPLLFGGWSQPDLDRKPRALMLGGMIAALMGVLMASTRLNVVMAGILIVAASFMGGLSGARKIIWIGAIGLIVVVALSNERFQRFKQLGDTDMVTERVTGSVNRSFLEILTEYPLGNGLGGGGTSIPYFLQSQLRNPVQMENEYARILLEQGMIGLLAWIGFIGWAITRRFPAGCWTNGARLARLWVGCSLALGMIGIGMLTSIPGTFLLLMVMGWLSVAAPAEQPASVPALSRNYYADSGVARYA